MHLLHSTTKKLEEFVNPPDYAILSHRWREEEVLFADIHQEHAKGMKGYAKVEGCCEQARRDGYQYVWIDACCIDKNSSAELAEAINSMFTWYENAQVCYVYLGDVADNGDPGTESAFAQSDWFTRGWTLQELIAPTSLFFFDSHWREIGSKNSLAGLISSITRVHPDVLTRVNAGSDKLMATRVSFSVATKMSWAAGRKSTRPEDRAYSLMGIFKVHMPVIYGEGEKKAFFRLQLEIMRTSHDQSIFAWSNPLAGSKKSGTWPFALYPDYFAKSDNVEDVPSDQWIRYSQEFISSDVPRLDFAATNDGLDISLPLLPLVDESDEFIALLSCQRRTSDGEQHFVGIRLRRSMPNAERYERIDDHTLEDIIDPRQEFKFKQIHISYPLLSGLSHGTFFSTSTSLFIQNIGVGSHGFSVIDVETAPSCVLQMRDSNFVLQMSRPFPLLKPSQDFKGSHHLPQTVDSSWLASFTYHNSTTTEQFIVTVGISWVQDGGPWLRITPEKHPDQLSRLKIDWTSYQLKAGRKVTASVKSGGHASAGKKRSIMFDRYSVNITVYGDL
ncbi:heterokaryon incompatibility protein-domain-containing protein [Suillus clintonianus]|uniref:heterokaryon incompatibility protein-domain-containing protein n=1 Tax=Suillus clintonianus TaxID=1904413 RepID=UPI001B8742DE|nr:heterokaryon incompatibility protein-domain-containing protein [Suillus clintonianus]KAG2150852.1 heterokaryon incompatibility protein-domain-containing protein [Suillus clintonianus]